MLSKKKFAIGTSALLLVISMNFTHALSGYGFFSNNLSQNVWASTSSPRKTNPPSTERKKGKYDVNDTCSTEGYNGVKHKESLIRKCSSGGSFACESYQGYHYVGEGEDGKQWYVIEDTNL